MQRSASATMQAARQQHSHKPNNLLIFKLFIYDQELVRRMQHPIGRGAHFDVPEPYP